MENVDEKYWWKYWWIILMDNIDGKYWWIILMENIGGKY